MLELEYLLVELENITKGCQVSILYHIPFTRHIISDVCMHFISYLDLFCFTTFGRQRTVELEQVRRQKKKAQKIYGFTLAALSCMTVHLYNMPTPMVEQGNTSP